METVTLDPARGLQMTVDLHAARELGRPARVLPVDVDRPREVSGDLVLPTSGTSGRPQWVGLQWSALAACADAVSARVGFHAEGEWLNPLPLRHIGSLAVLLRAFRTGGCAHLVPFEAEEVARILCEPGVTHASLVGRMLDRVLETGRGFEDSSLVCVMVGGGPVAESLMVRAREAGLPVRRTYGLTEAGSTVTIQQEPDGPDSGRPLDGAGVRARDGQIEVRPVGDDRWLATGDYGHVDEAGRLHVLDRRDDLIVTGGKNVAPSHVEEMLRLHPDVQDACVVGVPDPSWGQKVVAVVDARENITTELHTWCRERLRPEEAPKHIVVWGGPLPRNVVGKLERHAVRSSLQAHSVPTVRGGS